MKIIYTRKCSDEKAFWSLQKFGVWNNIFTKSVYLYMFLINHITLKEIFYNQNMKLKTDYSKYYFDPKLFCKLLYSIIRTMYKKDSL